MRLMSVLVRFYVHAGGILAAQPPEAPALREVGRSEAVATTRYASYGDIAAFLAPGGAGDLRVLGQ